MQRATYDSLNPTSIKQHPLTFPHHIWWGTFFLKGPCKRHDTSLLDGFSNAKEIDLLIE